MLKISKIFKDLYFIYVLFIFSIYVTKEKKLNTIMKNQIQ